MPESTSDLINMEDMGSATRESPSSASSDTESRKFAELEGIMMVKRQRIQREKSRSSKAEEACRRYLSDHSEKRPDFDIDAIQFWKANSQVLDSVYNTLCCKLHEPVYVCDNRHHVLSELSM